MVRFVVLAVLSVALGAAPLAAEAQAAGKVIGYLSPGLPPVPSTRDPLPLALEALGWAEGKNVAFERRYGEGKPDRLPVLAAELVALKVGVIFAVGTPAALAARGATATIPIVMVNVADPVRSGLVTSLARPGGNVTGLAMLGPEITRKRLQLLREAVPSASVVGILYDPSNQAHLDLLTHDTAAAAALVGLKAHPLSVDASARLDAVFAEALRRRVDALILYPLNLAPGWPRQVAALAITHRLPLLTGFRAYAEQGALLAINASAEEVFQRAAAHVDRILRGAKPADLPVEQPTRFELVINLRTARALGLTIPPAVLARADEVIR
jgi:putative ABC transport system substrate-binding protein